MPVIINLGKPQTFPQSSSESSLTRICRLSRRLQAVIGWVRAWYGEESQAVIRAEETSCALQRLKWELERVQQKTWAAAV